MPKIWRRRDGSVKPAVHPVTGDVLCPNDGEYVNKRCWYCGTPRPTAFFPPNCICGHNKGEHNETDRNGSCSKCDDDTCHEYAPWADGCEPDNAREPADPPMTDYRLARIRERLHDDKYMDIDPIRDLLAEVDRLRNQS